MAEPAQIAPLARVTIQPGAAPAATPAQVDRVNNRAQASLEALRSHWPAAGLILGGMSGLFWSAFVERSPSIEQLSIASLAIGAGILFTQAQTGQNPSRIKRIKNAAKPLSSGYSKTF